MVQNGKIEIHKGIPIPERRGGPGAKSKYPLADMGIGECFFLPVGGTLASASGVVSYWQKKLGRRFTLRRLPEGRIGCWRVS